MQPLLGASPAWWILLNEPPERDQDAIADCCRIVDDNSLSDYDTRALRGRNRSIPTETALSSTPLNSKFLAIMFISNQS
ncbi:MAG: hypothetical protein OSA84_13470, partial [Akkermansiaceae bacterium]|nr:hypothetical protein [Akkermansiaceae bacterium]